MFDHKGWGAFCGRLSISIVQMFHVTYFQQHLHSSSIHKEHRCAVNDNGVVLVHMAMLANVGFQLLRKAIKLLFGLKVVLGTRATQWRRADQSAQLLEICVSTSELNTHP